MVLYETVVDSKILAHRMYMEKHLVVCYCRIGESKQAEDKVVDVDGSYLWRTYQSLCGTGANVLPITQTVPDPPLLGWEVVTKANYKEFADRIPKVTAGTLLLQKSQSSLHVYLLHYFGIDTQWNLQITDPAYWGL